MMMMNTTAVVTDSGVTRVGVTRGGSNRWVSLYFFLKKSGDLFYYNFLVIASESDDLF